MGIVSIDFASKTPMVQARKQTRIPSVWTKDELKALINAINRESPKGKCDYAIILLACSLGLRCTDIRQLSTENFHWEARRLVVTQSKTKEPLVLPLIPEVGWAVIDYLRYGRPKVDSPYIFIRHIAPFLPFSEGDHLNQIIRQYMYPLADRLSKEIVLDWGKRRSHEAQATQCSRAPIMRQFGKYMDFLGFDAHIIPKGYYPTGERYILHIYTQDELERLVAETDECHYCIECPNRHLIMPVFFRMIYSCGLRVSEARFLKVSDVDLEKGILVISHSKGDNSRLVPMSEILMSKVPLVFDRFKLPA